METNSSTLGILGGLGPMSSAYFYELITTHTQADCDQQHLDIIISSKATTPDRTMFITGRSNKDPLPVMREELNKLIEFGASVVAIPCNTAHHFYNSLCNGYTIPILNIITLTVQYAAYLGVKSLGIMATEGTILAESYKKSCEEYSIKYITPSRNSQELLSSIIYNNIKRGDKPDIQTFKSIENELMARGCDYIVLGCTELSLIAKSFEIGNKYIDSLDILAACSIAMCNKNICKYPSALTNFAYSLCLPERTFINDTL